MTAQPDAAPPAALIELNDARVTRDGRTALAGVQLRIPLGRHTAILGPNGCGKSTFIKLMTRELYPQARADGLPAVRILGAAQWNVREMRSRLGIVSGALHDDLLSLPGLRAEDVVLGAFDAMLAAPDPEAVTATMRLRAQQALQRIGAGDLADREYASLSTGEARRVLIARALVHAPQALLLDEPTAGLDLVARARLLSSLRSLARDGITLVLVTHHLEELIPEIAHVVLLRAGEVFADGPRREVLTGETLSALFDAPVVLDDTGTSARLRDIDAGAALDA